MITENHIIDSILSSYQKELGNDREKYRNHIYRVYNFVLFLGENTLDETDKEKLAIACAFHDLAIWTHKTFDYLKPSTELAAAYLKENGKTDWIKEVSIIIDMHHKISSYTGAFEKSVEIFRKADWADVTMGIRSSGLTSQQLKEVKTAFPYLGFHHFLVVQSLKNFARHPFDPLPMFKR